MKNTRAKKAAPPKSTSSNVSLQTTTTPLLPPPVPQPPHLFILPKNLSASSRILTLPDPATSNPSRYLIDPSSRRCYEFTRLAAPGRSCRSWLLAPARGRNNEGGGGDDQGYVISKPDLLLATPLDPLFLILPALAADGVIVDSTHRNERGPEGGNPMFLSRETYLDRLEDSSPQFRRLMRDGANRTNIEAMFEARIASVCEGMEIGGEEKLYRLSIPKLLSVLVSKAKKIVDTPSSAVVAAEGVGGGLFPPTMEEKFVKQVLAPPVLSVRREESSVSFADRGSTQEGGEGVAGDGAVRGEGEGDIASSSLSSSEEAAASTSQPDSQASGISTPTTSFSTTTTAATSVISSSSSSSQPDSLPSGEAKENEKNEPQIAHLLRLRTVLDYLLRSYVSPSLREILTTALTSTSTNTNTSAPEKEGAIPDFAPLTTHLTHLSTLRKQAAALRSLSDNISRKRAAGSMDEDEEEAREKAEAKKRKKEEEEVRRKNVSRGVKQLEKVDRSGMRSLSSFFGAKPKPAAEKAGVGMKGGG